MMCYKSPLANFSLKAVYLESEPRDRARDHSEDARWVAQCLQGDLTAFEPLVRKYERVLFTVALRMVGDYEDARDATQVTFLRAYEGLDRYDPNRKFFSWIYRIAVNECLNVKRGQRPQEALVDQADTREGPFDALDRAETRIRVEAALQALTFEYREVIVLRHFADLSYEEIAEAVSAEPKTVKSRLFSARQKLAALLGMP